jgi:hypothetical protein
VDSGETNGVNSEANDHPSNGPVGSKNEQLTAGKEDQTPVGLRMGLASHAGCQETESKSQSWCLICCTAEIMFTVKKALDLFVLTNNQAHREHGGNVHANRINLFFQVLTDE